MLLTMGVSLFTVRVVLDTLGAVDYGLYNVVGGVVTMFSFLSGTMANASQRFFSFELGRKDLIQLKKTFSMTMTIYACLAIVILILAESVGLWFLNNRMTIPADRMVAANWVYQFSIFAFMMTMFTVPYNALIIAHERMKVFAYVSILEVTLKLLIVYLLLYFSFDKLILYSILTFLVTTIITMVYRFYCRRQFQESKFSFHWNKALFNEILNYSGWNLFGALASIFNNQGVNILLNIFFGPVVNAARAIAYKISSVINQFVMNFMTATQPQIIKYHALGDNKSMLDLVFKSSKLSYLLIFILSMPVLLESEFIFSLWLNEIPDYVIVYTRLIVIAALIDSLSFPLKTAAQATGKIKKYQISVGTVMLLTLPTAYLFYEYGFSSETVFYIAIINSIVCLFLRLILLSSMVGLKLSNFFSKVIFPIIIITISSYVLPLLIIYGMNQGILRFFLILVIGTFSTILFIYTLGMSRNEKKYIMGFVKNKLKI